MDALWNLEEKLKISTQKSVILLVCTSILVILACLTIIVVILKNKASQNNRIMSHDDSSSDEENESMIMYATTTTRSSSKCGLLDVRSALMASPCWSRAHKWNGGDGGGGGVMLGGRSWSLLWNKQSSSSSNCLERCTCVGGRSKLASVWQRPILMGEKCELPTFSGLILYDERGRPLPHHHHHHHQYRHSHDSATYQEEAEDGRATMLIDLL